MRNQFLLAKNSLSYWVSTPFDCINILSGNANELGSKVRRCLKSGDGESPEERSDRLLRDLPILIDEVKREMIISRTASAYYRQRYRTGMKKINQELSKIQHLNSTPLDRMHWAKKKCIPLDSSSSFNTTIPK